MAAIVNDRDVLIMAAVPRFTVGNTSGMFLTPPAAVFKTSASGLSATPSSFVFKATLLNLVGTVTFTWSAGLSFVINGNEATLNFASFSAASGTLTASITVDGVLYSQTSTITKLADGLPGTPGLNSPPQTAAQLKDTLLGQITKDQFVTSLQDVVGLIDAPATTAGSVAARLQAEAAARAAAIKTETDARAGAISKEITERGAAITAAVAAEAGARTTYVQNYALSREESAQSYAQQASTITAAYKTYTDDASGKALTDAKAFVQSWGYSVADANSAIAQSAAALQSHIDSAVSSSRSFTETWGYSKSAVDSAETAQFNALTANYMGYADGVGQAATRTSAADVRGYTMSTAGINGAITARSDALTAAFQSADTTALNAAKGYADTKKAEAITASDAAMRTYAASKADLTGAVSSITTELTSSFSTGIGAIRVAGANIVPDSAFERGTRPWTTRSGHVKDVSVAGVPGAKYLFIEATNVAGPDNDAYVNGDGPNILVTPGRTYVIAFDYATAQASSITGSSCYMYMYDSSGSAGGFGMPIPILDTAGVRQRASMVWTCPPGVLGLIPRFGIHTTGYAWMAIYNIMVAEGNKDPGYSPSPEDAPAGIAAARTYADSAIRAYTMSSSDINGAIAQSTNTLTARLNGAGGPGVTIEQAFTAQASSITGLSGQWAIKLNAAGQVAGIGLASSSATGTPTSIFTVVADKFALAYPGLNSKIPFVIGKVAGQSVIGFDGSVVIDGSLVIRAADGSLILGAGGLQPGYEAPGTKNSDLPPLVSNMLTNSLPSSLGDFTGGVSNIATGQWAVVYEANSFWTSRSRGVVYAHAFGTPAVGAFIDLYDQGVTHAKRMDVIPGDKYEFSVALSIHRCVGTLRAVFYKANGDYAGESAMVSPDWSGGASATSHPGDAFPRALVFAVAPAEAAKVMMVVRLLAYGGDDCYVFTSEWYAGRASSTQTLGTKYTEFSSTGLSASIAANKASADATKALAEAQAADGILDRGEKSLLKEKWAVLEAEFARLNTPVVQVAANAEWAAYVNSRGAVANFLNAIGPGGTGGWSNTDIDSPIDRAAYIGVFSNYADKKMALQNAVDAKSATTADWGKLASRPSDAQLLNSNAVGNTNLIERVDLMVGDGTPVWIYRNTSATYGSPLSNGYGAINGLHAVFPKNSTLNMLHSRTLNLEPNSHYTLSFTAYGEFAAGTVVNLVCDLQPDTMPETFFKITAGCNVYQTTWYVGNLPEARSSSLRIFNGGADAAGQIVVFDIKLERGVNKTAWRDDVIGANEGLNYIMPGAVNNTMIGGDIFSSNWNGIVGPGGAGWLMQRSGTLFAADVRLRGGISGGSFTNDYAWPAAGLGGYHLSASGLLLGNGNGGTAGFFQVDAAGNIYAPGFTLINRRLTLTDAYLIAPKIGDSMSASVSPAYGSVVRAANVQFTDAYAGTFTASGNNMGSNLSYFWTAQSESSQVTVSITGSRNAQCTVYVSGRLFAGYETNVILTCSVTDVSSSVVKGNSASINIQVQ